MYLALYSVGDTVTLGVWTTPTTWLGEHTVVDNSGVASVDVSAYQSLWWKLLGWSDHLQLKL